MAVTRNDADLGSATTGGTAPTTPSSPLGAALSAAGPTDADLAQRIASGDREAAGMFIDRHQETVRRFLRRLTGRADLADDLAQDTFVRVLRSAGRYDSRYPMRTWLFTIAHRLAINHAARANTRVVASEFEHISDRAASPAEAAQRRDYLANIRTELNQALAQLSDSQRSALLLVHQQGLSIQQAAIIMGVPEGTVKSHLHRGRNIMRQLLSPDLEGK